MRFPLTVFSAMVLVGCDSYHPLPTYPDPPRYPAEIQAMAFDEGDNCIGNTTIELIKGQTIVETGRHDANCGAWDGGGVILSKATYGEEVTLRASAAGYQSQEKTVVVTEKIPFQQLFVFFTLRRIQ